MAKRENKDFEEKKKSEIPKLSVAHFKEITQLVIKYGGTLKVLAHWKAITLNEDGSIKAVLDHSEHNDQDQERYEKLEPLKGIKYMGNGVTTYMPYIWCTEWLRQWEWWVNENKHLPEVKPILAKPDRIKNLKLKL